MSISRPTDQQWGWFQLHQVLDNLTMPGINKWHIPGQVNLAIVRQLGMTVERLRSVISGVLDYRQAWHNLQISCSLSFDLRIDGSCQRFISASMFDILPLPQCFCRTSKTHLDWQQISRWCVFDCIWGSGIRRWHFHAGFQCSMPSGLAAIPSSCCYPSTN